jgi:hypothetical protein
LGGNATPNMPVQTLKVAFLLLDLPCSVVTHSEEIIVTGESHKQKPEGIFLKEDSEMKMLLRLKYATWRVRGLGEKEVEVHRT